MNRFVSNLNVTEWVSWVPITVLVAFLYAHILKVLASQWWNDPNYSHGLLIPMISGYFIWQKRSRLREIPRDVDYRGLLLLLPGLGIYIIGIAGAEQFSMRLSLIVVLGGLVFYFGGKELVKGIWFPISFLVFMVPLPYVVYFSATFPMQAFSTRLTHLVLNFIGIVNIRQGNIIHLSNYSLEVIEACSGLRSVMTLSALAAALAYVAQKSTWGKVTLFLSAIPIAILANLIRLVLTAVIAMTFGISYAEGFLHEASGIIVFLSALIMLGVEGGILNWIGRRKNIG